MTATAALTAAAAPAATAEPAVTTAAPAVTTARAWVLVDVDTGNVIDAGNDRVPVPPASLTKVITALAASTVAPDTPVIVSAQAAAAPADKISLKQGEVWTADELFHALLISSANDAAVALAEQAGGTLDGFRAIFDRTALGLGMVDHPVLVDPAGLDGPQGVDGGNLVSARDLAIAGRALLAAPYLATIVATPIYYFVGPGGVHHRLTSHNYQFLATYPGAIGVKTGYTVRAGSCVMAAARVGGRTMLAVVLHSPNPDAAAEMLLDQGFATPVTAEPTADRLPPVNLDALRPPVAAIPVASSPPTPVALPDALSSSHSTSRSFQLLTAAATIALLLSVSLLIAATIRRQQTSHTNSWLPEP